MLIVLQLAELLCRVRIVLKITLSKDCQLVQINFKGGEISSTFGIINFDGIVGAREQRRIVVGS